MKCRQAVGFELGVPGEKLFLFFLVLFVLSMSLSACFDDSSSSEAENGDDDVEISEIRGISDVSDDPAEEAETDLCLNVECPTNATCNSETGQCRCDDGYEALGDRCVAQSADGDLDDEEVSEIEGESWELEESEEEPEVEESLEFQEEEESDSTEEVGCSVPQAPTLSIIHQGVELVFSASGGGNLQVGTTSDLDATEPNTWVNGNSVTLDQTGFVNVFARVGSGQCEPQRFEFTYEVREHYPPVAGEEGSTAVAMDDASIVGWATGVEEIIYGENVGENWKKPDKALGTAEGTSFDIVSLGRGGEITLSFDPPIVDGEGYDFAVFENGFSDGFLELGYVEISSDGETFLRFDHAYLGSESVGGFANHDTSLIGSLAGKYKQGYGDPYDLSVFVNRPEVLEGVVDLQDVRYVKIVDIVGDGRESDSFGHVIYDPYPTSDSVGFDLDAVGVLNH